MSQISFCRTFRRFAAADTDDEGQATRKQILIGGGGGCVAVDMVTLREKENESDGGLSSTADNWHPLASRSPYK